MLKAQFDEVEDVIGGETHIAITWKVELRNYRWLEYSIVPIVFNEIFNFL